MADEKSQELSIRAEMAEMLKRAPTKVLLGSVQLARDFKKWHAGATKLLDSSRSNLSQLQSMHNQTLDWYR